MKSDDSSSTGSASVLEAREAAPQRHLPHVVLVEVDEADALVLQVIVEAGAREQVLRVAAVARAFADDDRRGAGAAERDGRADDDHRVGVDRGARLVLDHVRLEEHARPRTSTPSSREPAPDQRREVDVVGARRQQRDRRPIERLEVARVVRRGGGRPRRRAAAPRPRRGTPAASEPIARSARRSEDEGAIGGLRLQRVERHRRPELLCRDRPCVRDCCGQQRARRRRRAAVCAGARVSPATARWRTPRTARRDRGTPRLLRHRRRARVFCSASSATAVVGTYGRSSLPSMFELP